MKNIISWRTKKVVNGLEARVIERTPHEEEINNSYATTKVLKTVVLPTRARAKSHAIKLVRYFRAA